MNYWDLSSIALSLVLAAFNALWFVYGSDKYRLVKVLALWAFGLSMAFAAVKMTMWSYHNTPQRFERVQAVK